MRTLDEAINHYEWCALESLGECSDEARQMADWLKELKRLQDIVERMLPILNAPGFDCYACPVEESCDVEHDDKCLLVEWARDMGIEVE